MRGESESKVTPDSDQWRGRIVEDDADIARIINSVSRVAVVGIKPVHVGGPAFYVPETMQQWGFTIIPMPVYYPEVTEILGEPVHRSLSTIHPPPDMVQLFRRSADVPQHVGEILAAHPQVVWMQLGIRNDAVAEQLARAGITVVQDRCLSVELERLRR